MGFPADNLLEIVDLACVRGDHLLFEELSLTLAAGEVCQVHGPNGSGKTSLLRIVCALGLAERGEVRWNGTPISELGEDYRAALSYVGHLNGIKGELTALENLEATRALAPTRTDAEPLDVLAEAGLAGFEEVPCRYLSAGQKRRVSIARLLLSACPLWVLDEPATALDSKGVEAFQRLVERHAASGGMVLITSHQALAFGAATTRTLEL